MKRDIANDVDPDWAWSSYQPSESRPWTLAMAGHLYRRAAFGATYSELQQAVSGGPQKTVDRLLRGGEELDAFHHVMDQDELASAKSGNMGSLRAWWLRRMLKTPYPLLEKMTLFWHSHFGISGSRVGDSQLMLQHIRVLREHALGKYSSMLDAVSQDPAVYLGLGAQSSRKAQPNEEFARQLMHRLSLGPGNFGEEDVSEASRAFTGWVVLRGQLRFFDREHDTGVKKILGRSGNWKAEDVLRIVLEQPVAPRMLVRKLYRWFVSEVEDPSDRLLDPLAEMLAKDYDTGRVVETMLRSNHFFSAAAYRRRIKSPVEFALEIVRGMEGTLSTVILSEELAQLGQNLYNPPTVDGWYGGRHWINSATMTGRCNLAHSLFARNGRYGGKLDPTAIASRYGYDDPTASPGFLVALFLQDDLPKSVREELRRTIPSSIDTDGSALRQFASNAAALTEFQLS
ncbi:hypothetical protein CA13_15800 [Planctomycetes bacterium CA13]|uniref:DUF1800 domain-containing protein n=1 Tax=Novipirellula herctigrandis TaxID=2527986 RepID=A0A5C5Z011_9BACT|nr:hypothetical protein CA13_15800 [Planctomycetes bacterium CA13]